MAELKTKKNDLSVTDFLNSVEDEQKRKDSFAILEMMKKVTKEEPRMWGASLIGFGQYHYKGKSGREGDWLRMGFSPRKQNLSLYLMTGLNNPELLKKLGKFKTGAGCLYINSLEQVDKKVLKELMAATIEESYKLYKK